MKKRISLGSLIFHGLLLFFVLCFLCFGRAEAALTLPKKERPRSDAPFVPSTGALSNPEVYITDTLPFVDVPDNAEKTKEDYFLHDGRKVSNLYTRYVYIKDGEVFLYQVVLGDMVAGIGDSNIVLWQQWVEKDGTIFAALLRQDGGGYTVARNAYVVPFHGLTDSDGKTLLQARLVSESIPDGEAYDKKMGDKGVFAVEEFDYLKVRPPQKKKRFSM